MKIYSIALVIFFVFCQTNIILSSASSPTAANPTSPSRMSSPSALSLDQISARSNRSTSTHSPKSGNTTIRTINIAEKKSKSERPVNLKRQGRIYIHNVNNSIAAVLDPQTNSFEEERDQSNAEKSDRMKRENSNLMIMPENWDNQPSKKLKYSQNNQQPRKKITITTTVDATHEKQEPDSPVNERSHARINRSISANPASPSKISVNSNLSTNNVTLHVAQVAWQTQQKKKSSCLNCCSGKPQEN